MASTAAMVFFWRPGRMSRSALLTGFLVGAGAVCATAAAASNSKAESNRVFIESSWCGVAQSYGINQLCLAGKKQVLRFAQDDNPNLLFANQRDLTQLGEKNSAGGRVRASLCGGPVACRVKSKAADRSVRARLAVCAILMTCTRTADILMGRGGCCASRSPSPCFTSCCW